MSIRPDGKPDKKRLIITADDFGMCHAVNAAVAHLIKDEQIGSTTLMVPCSWALEAASIGKAGPGRDIGIHLTFTSEWLHYKWGPSSNHHAVPSLTTEFGYFPATSEQFEVQAERKDVRRELFQQIETGIRMGIDPTHLDNHMGSLYGLQTGNDFLDIVFDACEQFQLPFRLPKSYAETHQLPVSIRKLAERRIDEAERRGIEIIDHLIQFSYFSEGKVLSYSAFKQNALQLLSSVKPGVTEWIFHPSAAELELKFITPRWRLRTMEYELLRDDDFWSAVDQADVELIQWQDLREIQRKKNQFHF